MVKRIISWIEEVLLFFWLLPVGLFVFVLMDQLIMSHIPQDSFIYDKWGRFIDRLLYPAGSLIDDIHWHITCVISAAVFYYLVYLLVCVLFAI